MTQETIFWIVGQSIFIIGVLFTAYLRLLDKISAVNERVIALEVMINIFGKKAAAILHSPTNHLGVDELLDRYIANHNDLPCCEWLELRDAMDKIMHSETTTNGERALAAWLSALSEHKLSRFSTKEKETLMNLKY